MIRTQFRRAISRRQCLSFPFALTAIASLKYGNRVDCGVRSLSFTEQEQPHDENKDCPLCRRYGQGPCAELFYEWWNCTKQHEKEHLVKCEQYFDRFQKCIDQHSDIYDAPVAAEDNSLSEDWRELIEQELSILPKKSFQPVQLQWMKDQYLSITLLSEDLVLAFVESGEDNRLLVAGQKGDFLHNADDTVRIYVNVPQPVQTITISVLYEPAEVVCVCSVEVPR